MNFKNIHIGQLIQLRVAESGIEMSRICNFLKSTEAEIEKMYYQKGLDSELLLRWSKLLEYDFFRLYTQHLILYSPHSTQNINSALKKNSNALPLLRKNIYTSELILFILELIETKKKTKLQIINEYGIPKTTLYKWMEKYKI